MCECECTQVRITLATICKHTHRLVAQPDDVRHRTGSAILHDNPQVCVLEITAIVLHDIGATNKYQTQYFFKAKQQVSCQRHDQTSDKVGL